MNHDLPTTQSQILAERRSLQTCRSMCACVEGRSLANDLETLRRELMKHFARFVKLDGTPLVELVRKTMGAIPAKHVRLQLEKLLRTQGYSPNWAHDLEKLSDHVAGYCRADSSPVIESDLSGYANELFGFMAQAEAITRLEAGLGLSGAWSRSIPVYSPAPRRP